MNIDEIEVEIHLSIDKSKSLLDMNSWSSYADDKKKDRYIKMSEAHSRRIEALSKLLPYIDAKKEIN